MAYAAWSDVVAYCGSAVTLPSDPAEMSRLLNRASEQIDLLLIGAVFATDTNGNPTDATVLFHLKQAVCAQIEWWLLGGDETGAAGLFEEMSLGPARLKRRGGTISDMGSAYARLAPRARDELIRGDLYGNSPVVI